MNSEQKYFPSLQDINQAEINLRDVIMQTPLQKNLNLSTTTPQQKIKQVKMFGKEFVEVILSGDTFDDAQNSALDDSIKTGMAFIHPFDDPQIIEGQSTVALEILQDTKEHIDYVFIPIGGGGLAAGIGAYFKQVSPQTKIIGVEPAGALSIAALDFYRDEIKGKNVACIVSASNLIQRMEENGFVYEYLNEKLDLFQVLI